MIPAPDPTLLTTANLIREIAALKEFLMREVVALKDLHEEKFGSIAIRFQERDTAVQAAFAAAKEAVGEQNKSSASAIAKAEAHTSEQLRQIMSMLTNSNKAADEKIADLKERVGGMENRGEGQVSEKTSSQHSIALIVSVASLVIAAIVAALAVMRH